MEFPINVNIKTARVYRRGFAFYALEVTNTESDQVSGDNWRLVESNAIRWRRTGTYSVVFNSPSTFSEIEGMLLRTTKSFGAVITIVKVALTAGSSQQGKAIRASTGSN